MTVCFGNFGWSHKVFGCLTRDKSWYDWALVIGVILTLLIIGIILYHRFRK